MVSNPILRYNYTSGCTWSEHKQACIELGIIIFDLYVSSVGNFAEEKTFTNFMVSYKE